ncbi:MAG: PaaI family thioesterase [Elusimicrobia bacterium]|nr:PaaI family thioesterase [Elusimicrobiota bacterium]
MNDLVDVSPFPNSKAERTFTGGILEAERIALRYQRRGKDGPLIAKVRFGPHAEGAPRRAHGGAVLTVLDEAMGAACWVRGWPVLTARISAAFRRAVPLSVNLHVETDIVREHRRLVFVTSRLVDSRGGFYAEAEASFARLSPEQLKAAGL